MGCVSSPVTGPMLQGFMQAIGSPMRFDPDTIDQSGKQVAKALHGMWMAPAQCFDDPDVGLMIGANPLISYTAVPMGHPGKWLHRWSDRGFQLIVVDSRLTDVDKRAALHL